MTSRQRLLAALDRTVPDHLPVTTHHVMGYFLKTYLGGASNEAFFDRFGMDAIRWVVAHRPGPGTGEYIDPLQGSLGFLEARRITTDQWRVVPEDVPGRQCVTTRFRFLTPRGELMMTLQSNEHTTWVVERLIEKRSDIELIAEYTTAPKCDVNAVESRGGRLRRPWIDSGTHLLLRRFWPARLLAGRRLSGRH